MEKLEFIDENGEKTQFYVIEETRINGINYLLSLIHISEPTRP